VRIEPVLVDDAMAGTIADLVNRSFLVEAWFVDGDRISPEGVSRLAADPRAQFFVAFAADGAPIGSIYREVREGGRGYFGLLAVDESRQGAGIGAALVDRVEDDLRRRGCDSVEITVVDLRRELFPYYEKRGYRVDGRTAAFPRVAKRDCILIYMSKPL
jgi:GNAT superfamily N-acetyltransferase